jgi:hypothetical protein
MSGQTPSFRGNQADTARIPPSLVNDPLAGFTPALSKLASASSIPVREGCQTSCTSTVSSSPAFEPSPLRTERTVCYCGSRAFAISATVAPSPPSMGAFQCHQNGK